MPIPSALPPPAAPPPSLPPPQVARSGTATLVEAASNRAKAPPDARDGAGADPKEFGGLPNPSIRMDPALGIVVLEFRDQRGAVRSIPTERELEAYRLAASRNERAGEAPPPAPAAPVEPS